MADEPSKQPPAAPARRVVSLRHPGFIGKTPAAAPTQGGKPAAPKPVVDSAPSPSAGGSIADASRQLVETIVATFTDRLKSEAQKRDGSLDSADIDRLADELGRKRAQLEAVFRQTFENYVRARERAAFDHARQYPFDRLIVNTFAELFSPRRADLDGLDRVTRQVLPGFFLALDRMVPPDRIEEFQRRCRAILARINPGDEQVMDWNLLYADPDAKLLLLDALAAFAPYFESFEKRRGWFLPLVNDHLLLNGEDDWVLTPTGFINLALAMFAPLRAELNDLAGRGRMMDRYGAAECQRILMAIQALWRAANAR